MAFIFKNNNSKFWIAGFRDKDQKRRNRSTKLPATDDNRRKAQKIADSYEATAVKTRSSQQVRRVMAELHKDLTGYDLQIVTVSEHVSQWLESKKSSVAANSYASYDGIAQAFLRFLADKRENEVAEISRQDVEAFRDDLAKRLSSKSANKHLKVVKMLFRDARDRTLIADDPTEFVKTVKNVKESDRQPFTLEQIRLILTHCSDEWRSMVIFGFYTGLRLGDIATMKWNRLDLGRGYLKVTTGKTGKYLNVPLPPPLWDHLKSLPIPLEPAFPIHPNAAAVVENLKKVANLSNQFGAILATAGLREKRAHKKLREGRDAKRQLNPLSFHSLRATATTFLHEARSKSFGRNGPYRP